MENMVEIIVRSVLAFAIMMLVTRTLGKATISQLTYHDFVAAITLGAITGNLAFNLKSSIGNMITSILTFAFIAYLVMVLVLKSRLLRKWLSGQPTLLIEDGKILEQNMKKLRITLDMLNQELREKNVFDMETVQYATLEPNGKVSVLLKPEYQPVIRKDLRLISLTEQSYPIELIMDGKIVHENFKSNNLTTEWLQSEVNKLGLSLDTINYAVKSSTGKLYVDQYEDNLKTPIDTE